MTTVDTGARRKPLTSGPYNGTCVGPGVGLQLSEVSRTPGRLLFIGHHGAYEVNNMVIKIKMLVVSP